MRRLQAAAIAGGVIAAASVGGGARATTPGALLPPPTDLTRPQAPLTPPAAPLVIQPGGVGAPPPGAADIQVQVAAIEVDGVTAYQPGVLDPLWRGLVGRKVALSELFAAAQRIEARYRADGYVLARAVVPQQSVADGRFRILVVEGYVSQVKISGDAGGAAPLVRRYLEKITLRRPARLQDLERYLLLANDIPGVSVRAVLTADPDQPGAADLVAEAHYRPAEGYVTLNNRGSVFAGPVTGTIGAAIDDLGPTGARISGTYFTTFNDEQQLGEIDVETRVGDEGGRVRVWASDSPSTPGSIFKPLDLNSISTVYGIQVDEPVLRSRRLNLTLHGDFEATEDTTRSLGTLLSRDVQRILRFGVEGDARDAWGGRTTWDITGHQGLSGLGASQDGDAIPQSRLGGRADFFKVTVIASRVQPLFDAGPNSLALQVSAAGQYAANRLLSSEQLHIGGEEFGRGYNPSQVSGDDGLGVDAELQFTGLQRFGPVTGHQLYAFFDAAAVEDRDGQEPWTELKSYGGGVRVDLGPHISAQLEVDVPYDPGRLNGAVHDAGPQVFFRLTGRY
jgi:hemolysin activation/secretion protein